MGRPLILVVLGTVSLMASAKPQAFINSASTYTERDSGPNPTRLDGLVRDMSLLEVTTQVTPKNLPALLMEIGRDPRDYFKEKVEVHKEAAEKVSKAAINDDNEDLKVLLEGINAGVDEWWRPELAKGNPAEEQRDGQVAVKERQSLIPLPQSDNSNLKIKMSPRKLYSSAEEFFRSSENDEPTTSSAGGSYSQVKIPISEVEKSTINNFDSSSEEELLRNGKIQANTDGLISWTERQPTNKKKSEGPSRFNELKSKKSTNTDLKAGEIEVSSEHLVDIDRPFGLSQLVPVARAAPVFSSTRIETPAALAELPSPKEDERDEAAIDDHIAALSHARQRDSAQSGEEEKHEHRGRQSTAFQQDDSDEDIHQAVERSKHQKTLNIRQLTEDRPSTATVATNAAIQSVPEDAVEPAAPATISPFAARPLSQFIQPISQPSGAVAAGLPQPLPVATSAPISSSPFSAPGAVFTPAPLPTFAPFPTFATPAPLTALPNNGLPYLSNRYGNPPITPLDNFPIRNDRAFQQMYTNFRNLVMQNAGHQRDTQVWDITNDPNLISRKR